ncbi:MAG: MFS transporter, partial [Pseudomonadota bacterium]
SGALPAAAGFLADISRPEDRLKAMTLPSRAFALGGLAGLCLIWPAAAVLGFTGPIFLVACLGAAVGTGALVLIDDRRVYLHGPQCNDSLWIDRPVGPHPRQHGLLAVNMLAFSCVSLIQTTVPFLVQDQFGLQMGETISFSTGLGLTLSLSTLAALRVARIPGPAYGTRAIWLAASGLSVAAMGACALYAGGFPAVLFLAHALIGFGFGLFVPSTQCLLSIRTSQGEQAHAAGRLSAAATAGYVIGPLVGAFLYADIGPWIYLISMAVLAALAACLLVQRPRKRLHASIQSRPDTP